ncbi:putative Bardet-Biedl syndrome 4 protein-like protein [Hypsibius exemplaris]|uniref:Bardet-Biedl syndrome 4 protein-like protein n=1 Tax=Hypsibius exemplaris TaxID=2072580 RepID=A0A1W0WR88_HYPEX|nr:putative Bardet-Biedl syndrome 4 protein-like protein [Hypsibius exemplaris]
MSTEALQNSSNAFPITSPGQYPSIIEVPRKGPLQNKPEKTILQQVQDSDSRNWLYYQLFLRQDFDACDVSLATTEASAGVQSTYAIYMKGLIAKRQGKLDDALNFMKQCYIRDRMNWEVLKELTSLSYLTRAYQEALSYVELAKELEPAQDWFMAHHQGLCYERIGELSMGQHDFSRGFGNLAQAVSGTKTQDESVLLAVGSVMQRKVDIDGALKKYEAILQDPSAASPAVLNNVGLCYLAKPRKSSVPKKDNAKGSADEEYSQHILYAVGCLKKAQQMAPLNWRISCNLGYLMRELRLYATASYYFMASIRLGTKTPSTEAYLMLAGVADNLEISSQANQVYKYCVKHNSSNDPVVYLNYATFLAREGEKERAAEMAIRCRDAVTEWEQIGRPVESSITEMLRLLKTKMPIPNSPAGVQDSPLLLATRVSTSNLDITSGGSHEVLVSAQVEQSN